MEKIEPAVPKLVINAYYYPPIEFVQPAPLAVQVTSLVDSYMIWVGVTDEIFPENAEKAPSSLLTDDALNGDKVEEEGSHLEKKLIGVIANSGKLARDWGCAMPSANVSVIEF